MASTSSSLHCSSSSAQETTDTVCLACGKEAVARERRKLESRPGISALLTGLLLRRYGDTGDGDHHDGSADSTFNSRFKSLVQKSYMCRKCFESYKGHIRKEEHLYELTRNDHIKYFLLNRCHEGFQETCALRSVPCTPSTSGSSSNVAISSVTRKRLYSEIDNVTVSPPVSVSPAPFCL